MSLRQLTYLMARHERREAERRVAAMGDLRSILLSLDPRFEPVYLAHEARLMTIAGIEERVKKAKRPPGRRPGLAGAPDVFRQIGIRERLPEN